MGTTSGIAPTSLVIGARVKATTLMNAPPGGITPPADHFRWLSAIQAHDEMAIQVPAILAHEETVLTLEETQDQQPPTQAELPASLKTSDHAHDPCPPTQAELPVSLETLGHARDPCLPTAEEWITQGLAPRAALGSL